MTTFKKISRLLILLIFLSNSIFGQQTYQLAQLVNAALKFYPVIKQKEALYNASIASAREVQHSFLPQIKISD